MTELDWMQNHVSAASLNNSDTYLCSVPPTKKNIVYACPCLIKAIFSLILLLVLFRYTFSLVVLVIPILLALPRLKDETVCSGILFCIPIGVRTCSLSFLCVSGHTAFASKVFEDPYGRVKVRIELLARARDDIIK